MAHCISRGNSHTGELSNDSSATVGRQIFWGELFFNFNVHGLSYDCEALVLIATFLPQYLQLVSLLRLHAVSSGVHCGPIGCCDVVMFVLTLSQS